MSLIFRELLLVGESKGSSLHFCWEERKGIGVREPKGGSVVFSDVVHLCVYDGT